MEKLKVRDFMVSVADFPSISEETTFSEAVLALEKHFDEFMAGKAKQYITLVHDAQNRILGKMTPLDVLRGLEPGYDKIIAPAKHSLALAVDYVVETMAGQAMLWAKPFDDLCSRAQDVKVANFFTRPSENQTVQAGDSLNLAFHRFVIGRHDSLFVKEQGKLVGLLRFSDVYREVCRQIKYVCKA
jgi:CBS domain-containing protein